MREPAAAMAERGEAQQRHAEKAALSWSIGREREGGKRVGHRDGRWERVGWSVKETLKTSGVSFVLDHAYNACRGA